MGDATMDASSAAPASTWVGHQGAAAFDLRSEYLPSPSHLDSSPRHDFPAELPSLPPNTAMSRTAV